MVHGLSTLWEGKTLPCQPIHKFAKTSLIAFTRSWLYRQALQASKLFPDFDALLLTTALHYFCSLLTHFRRMGRREGRSAGVWCVST